MRNLGHIYWKTSTIHEILIIFDVFWTQKLKFYQYLTLFWQKLSNFAIYLPIFVKKYVNFLKFNVQFLGRFIIFCPLNGADLFSICRITTPAWGWQSTWDWQLTWDYQLTWDWQLILYIFLILGVHPNGVYGLEDGMHICAKVGFLSYKYHNLAFKHGPAVSANGICGTLI